MTSPLNNLTDTWNNSGTVFTALKYNVTDTASFATSLLMDLQIGTVSKCSVNKAGALSLAAGVSFAGGLGFLSTSGTVVLVGTTLTTSNPAVDAAQTWNASGVTFTGLKLNITNTASATGSLLYDFQLGGVSKATIDKLGSLNLYNVNDGLGNYERGVIDWTTNSNILTIGAQELGTGTARNVRLSGGASVGIWSAGTEYLRAAGGRTYFINSTPTASAYLIDTSSDNTGIYKVANGVLGIGPFSLTFYQWAGQSRVTSNFDTGNSTTLANITGLTTTLTAGRTYSFSAIIPTTSNVAAGVKFAIAGTATATDITYEAIVYSAGAVVAQTRASALATTVGAVTAVTAAYCQITGTITVNAGGTLTIQMAQNVGNATGSVALRGSSLFVYDMP